MKFRCVECERTYYGENQPASCPYCSGELENISGLGRKVNCEKSGTETWLIDGIPACDNYRMVNAQGARCLHGEEPGSCPYASLPDCEPRAASTLD